MCQLLVVPISALAQDIETTTISVQVERSSLPELPDHVAARLTGPSGEPIAGVSIDFWTKVEILGPRSAMLGAAMTDATGIARVPITPRSPEYEVRAEFKGSDLYAPAENDVVLTFPPERVDPVEVAAPTSPLATLRTVMPRAMGIVVAALWLFFVAAVFYVIRTIYRHSPSAPPALENR
jgi:hypothetical protein